jgi:hypothetical protein
MQMAADRPPFVSFGIVRLKQGPESTPAAPGGNDIEFQLPYQCGATIIKDIESNQIKWRSAMKSFIKTIPVLAAALLISSMPVLAGEGMAGPNTERGKEAQKDECLLVARDCSSDTINSRVERIEKEISKGSAVYTNEELNQLKRELEDASRIQRINENRFPPVSL